MRKYGVTRRRVDPTYFQKPGNEIGRQSLLSPEVLLFEVGHEMVCLAPEVHGFLPQSGISKTVQPFEGMAISSRR